MFRHLRTNVSIKVSKKKCDINENIEVTFKINFKADSIKTPDFPGFKRIGGHTTNKTTKIVNGRRTDKMSWQYTLAPTQLGRLYIESPFCYYEGREIKGRKTKVKVYVRDLKE